MQSKKVSAKDWLGDSDEEDAGSEEEIKKALKGKGKKIDTLLDESDDDKPENSFIKKSYQDEKKGRLLFELQKSFGGDKRFKLDEK